MTPLALSLNKLTQGENVVSLQSFPTRGKQRRPAVEVVGSSHPVSVIEVRIDATQGRRCTRRRPFLSSHSASVLPVRLGAGSSHSVSVLGVRRGAVLSHSDPSNTRLRRVLDMTGAGAHPSGGSAPRRRMRRKAVTTCNVDQEAYSSPLWRCSP
jgi:hypothetical protein